MWLDLWMWIPILVAAFLVASITPALAHQPVAITDAHTSAKAGPIMVDGTVSFAMRVNFTKANQERGFRISLAEDELLNFEYLIIDRAPENRLATKNEVVKILGRGELKAKLKVTAHKFTATAKAAIEAAGGEAVTL